MGDPFKALNHLRFDAWPYGTMRMPRLGEVRPREAVPDIGGSLGYRGPERRGRWYASFQFDIDSVDGERSDGAETVTRAKARKAQVAMPGRDDEGAPEPAAVANANRSRPVRVTPCHPRPGTVGAMDVGIVDAAVVSTGKGALSHRARRCRTRPDRRAAARRLIARQQRRLARSVQRTKLAAAVAARTLPDSPTMQDVHRFGVRYSRRQERRPPATSRLVWAGADRHDELLQKAPVAVARSAEVVVTETLHLTGLLRNRRLARSLSEAAVGRCVARICHQSEMVGGVALAAPRLSCRASDESAAVR